MKRQRKLDKLWAKICKLQGERWIASEHIWTGLLRKLRAFDKALEITEASVDLALAGQAQEAEHE